LPLTSEKINEFAVSKRDREHRAEEDYHDGTIFINVINQDEKLPYWFRQDHPFVFHDYYRLVSTTKSRVYFRLAISGESYRRETEQYIALEFKWEDAIHLMQQLKEAIDHQVEMNEWQERTEKRFQEVFPIAYWFRMINNEPIQAWEDPS
jgi:hypothetical protein